MSQKRPTLVNTSLVNTSDVNQRDVNQEFQEHQEHQDTQRNSTKDNETHRVASATSSEREKTGEDHRIVFERDLKAGTLSTLPFGTFLGRAIEESRREASERITWQSPLFYFIRLLQVHPTMNPKYITAKQALIEIERVMQTWSKERRRQAPERYAESDWSYWLDVEREDAHAEFLDTWTKVRFMPGFSPLAVAIFKAAMNPLKLHEPIASLRPAGYAKFISIAGWLQVAAGNRNIMLPVKDLAQELKCEPMTISRYRKWAEEDKFLAQVKPAKFFGPGKGGMATEFRFDVSRVPVLKDAAQKGTEETFGMISGAFKEKQ